MRRIRLVSAGRILAPVTQQTEEVDVGALLLRVIVTGIALWVATALVPGVEAGGEGTDQVITLALVAVIFGVVNAVIGPIIRVLALPLYVLTLGLIALLVNALLFWLTSVFAGALNLDFTVDGFVPAVLGALVVAIVSWAVGMLARD